MSSEKNQVRDALKLNNKHKGETVFIVGSGPSLLQLTIEQRFELSSLPNIGLNNSHLRVVPWFFLSAHLGQVLLFKRFLKLVGTFANSSVHIIRDGAIKAIHMRRTYKPLIDDVLTVQRRDFQEYIGLPKRLNSLVFQPTPILYTDQNAALAATHLAIIIGAKEIVYVAIEQKNKLHFYDLDPELRGQLRKDWEALRDYPNITIDHGDEVSGPLSHLNTPIEELARTQFYYKNHAATFRKYFRILDEYGIKYYTTAEGVLTAAGAPLRRVEDCL